MVNRDKSTGRFISNSNGNNGSVRGQSVRERAQAINEIVVNAATLRSQIARAIIDPRRDINAECGYPDANELTGEIYRLFYDREAVATRVVEILPQESWKVQPDIFETEDADEETDFEKTWRNLGRSLTLHSWYQGQEGGNAIWEYLRRADELSGIGSYGLLLLGIDDGLELDQPIAGVESVGEPTAKEAKLLYLRAFDESLVKITGFEEDKKNPRYGQPTMYNITFSGSSNDQSIGLSQATAPVHWTRVIHLADNLGSSEVFGVPRMRPVFNRLWDLRKLYGGSAEMYWLGAFPGLSIETNPQLGGDVSIDASVWREQMEKYTTGLQRYLAGEGVTVNSLAPQVVDPTPQIGTQIEAICIRLGIPKRVFMGSERGELSSSQDKRTWNERLSYRQANYVTPRIIVPFIDRLILIGVLPQPIEYSIVWPDLNTLTETEQADIAVKRTEAMTKYVQGSVEALMVPMDFLTRVLSLTQDEAEAVLESTMSELGTTSTLDVVSRQETGDEEGLEKETKKSKEAEKP